MLILWPARAESVASLLEQASSLQAKGKIVEAEPAYRQALDIGERELGPDHPDTLQALTGLASLLDQAGRVREAEIYYRRALTIQERTLLRQRRKARAVGTPRNTRPHLAENSAKIAGV
ncbi:MAG TPA: tetratricopeptide repeat protein [Bryobacteraceae bacterium]|nr:tetratricopeptide repeat protein [Bryobacteraceae bacterium]